jgi:putative tryptophan/tyrosine transport system substrate-binding protein
MRETWRSDDQAEAAPPPAALVCQKCGKGVVVGFRRIRLFGRVRLRRRDFTFLVCAATVAPRTLFAQDTNRQFRVGWLGFPSKDAPLAVKYLGRLLAGMRELGYAEGQNFELLARFADSHAERMDPLARELVQLKPDVIVGAASINAVALKKATDTIPIVVAALADPIELGLIKSYARPGENVTGIMPYVSGLPTKQLELARELVPGATRIGLLDDVTDPKARPQGREIKAAGEKLEINIIPAEVHTAADIGQAYETFSTGGAEIVVVEQSSMLVNAAQVIAEAAAVKKLPTLYGYHEHVEAGGLISYGVNLDWCFHRAAYYVDKILKGVKPADLPVEFPTTLELWINQKTARTLGVKIPPSVIVRADKIIE